MKRSVLALFGALAVLVGGGVWIWKTVRHARLDLVSLRVHDLPLSEALARMRRQTREEIVADRRFMAEPEVRVSLNLKAAPLAEALATVAEQAGGFWRATYAVHDKPTAAQQLADLLLTGVEPTGAGWTNLAGSLSPGFPVGLPPATGEPHVEALPPGFVPTRGGGPPGLRGMTVDEDVDVVDGTSPDVPTRNRRVIVGRVPGGSEAGGPPFQTFDLSPERVLLEDALISRLSEKDRSMAAGTSVADAQRLAQAVKGQCTTLYSVERSPIPNLPAGLGEMAGRGGPRLTWKGKAGPGEGLEGAKGPADLASRAEQEMRRSQFDRLERLTPEQRARQAADARMAGGTVIHTEEVQ